MSKIWDDKDYEDQRPAKITYQLYKTVKGTKSLVTEKKVSSKDGWAYTFTKLNTVDDKGNTITYTVEEAAVAGYTTEIDPPSFTTTLPADWLVTITRKNSLELSIGKSNIVIVNKGSDYLVWTDQKTTAFQKKLIRSSSEIGSNSAVFYYGDSGAVSSWGFTMLKDAAGNRTVKFNDKNNWSYILHGTPDLSTSAYATVTNTYTPPNPPDTKEITVTKTWANVPGGITHPTSVPIKLYKPGNANPVHSDSISGAGDVWTLPLTVPNATDRVAEIDENGNDIAEGGYLKTSSAWYTVTYSGGFTITNTYAPPSANADAELPTGLTIAKVDAGSNAITGEDKSAEFTLYKGDALYGAYDTDIADGRVQIAGLKAGVYTLKKTKASDGYQETDAEWTITVTASESTGYDAAANATTKTITYTVESVTLSEGSLEWNNEDNTLTVKNAQIPIPGTISIEGEKFWEFPNYNGLPDGVVLPEFVTIKLCKYVNDVKTEFGSAKPNQDGSWKYRFENIPEGSGYFVEEIGLEDGYLKTDTAWYDVSYPEDGYNVTNTYAAPDYDYDWLPASFTIRKEDKNGKLITGGSATFTLYSPTPALQSAGAPETAVEYKTGNTGIITITDLYPGDYRLKETAAPSRYKKSDTEWKITVTEDESTLYDKAANTWICVWTSRIESVTPSAGWNSETGTLTVANTKIISDRDPTPSREDPDPPATEIPETEPPLGPAEETVPPEATDPVEEIQEVKVPKDASPKTGDGTNTALLWAALGLSSGGISATILTGKRGKKRGPAVGK